MTAGRVKVKVIQGHWRLEGLWFDVEEVWWGRVTRRSWYLVSFVLTEAVHGVTNSAPFVVGRTLSRIDSRHARQQDGD